MGAGRVRVVVLGIVVAGLVAWPLAKGVSKLASKFRGRAPSASIDFPGQGSGVGCEVVVYGHVDPGTIPGALLLVVAEAKERWELVQDIHMYDSTWRAKVKLASSKGTKHRLAVVRIDVPFDDRLRAAFTPYAPSWTVDGRLRGVSHYERRQRALPFWELPPGATLVAAVDVFVVEACDYEPAAFGPGR